MKKLLAILVVGLLFGGSDLIFDRFSGDLLFRQFKDGKKNDFADFACKKAGKKLI